MFFKVYMLIFATAKFKKILWEGFRKKMPLNILQQKI